MSEKFLAGSIKNLANTCYLSCSLQILFRFQPFVSKLHEFSEKYVENDLIHLMALYSDRFLNGDTDLIPQGLLKHLEIDATKQEDICEFLTFFLDRIIESLPDESKNEIQELFNCRIVTNKDDKDRMKVDNMFFYTIPVHAGANINDEVKQNLISHNEYFEKAPDLFMLQIQRMTYDKITKELKKRSEPMFITDQLNVYPFGGRNYDLFCFLIVETQTMSATKAKR